MRTPTATPAPDDPRFDQKIFKRFTHEQLVRVFLPMIVPSDGRVIGRFAPSGMRPRVLSRLEELGLPMPSEIEPLFPEPVRQAQ